MKILKEDPDKVDVMGVKPLGWSRHDAKPFWAWKTWAIVGEVSYSGTESTNHPDMIKRILKWDGSPKDLLKNPNGNEIRLIGQVNKLEYAEFMDRAEANGTTGELAPRRLMGNSGVSGRMWTEAKIVSFWQGKNAVMPYLGSVDMAVFKITGDGMINGWKIQVIDVIDLIEYENWAAPVDHIKRSEEEVKALQMKQHLDPDAKRQVSLPMAGSIAAGRQARAQGFSTPAAMKFKQTVGDALTTKRADYLLPNP